MTYVKIIFLDLRLILINYDIIPVYMLSFGYVFNNFINRVLGPVFFVFLFSSVMCETCVSIMLTKN